MVAAQKWAPTWASCCRQETEFLILEEGMMATYWRIGFVSRVECDTAKGLLAAQTTLKAYKEIKNSNVLPWILESFALLMIPQGQWAQPTTLGFSVMAGGLVLATLNREAP